MAPWLVVLIFNYSQFFMENFCNTRENRECLAQQIVLCLQYNATAVRKCCSNND